MTLRTLSLFALGLFAAGCSAVTVPEYGADHPANRDAAQSAVTPRSQTLSTGGAAQMRATQDSAPEPAGEHDHGDDADLYACPMHPDVTSDSADSCPICGMDLVEKSKPPAGVLYVCPMHPDVTSDSADSCPICGMDLVEKPKPPAGVLYVCPMHPDVTSDSADSCPICGMDLIKKPPSEDGDRIHDL